jgi:ubiquinone/menaquinone biosynthesis C-methylase UbiE
MNHADHVQLIRDGIPESGGIWADMGSGEGAFTLALRDIAGPEVTIYSIDADAGGLLEQKRSFDREFPHTDIHFIHDDFMKKISVPPLDGIIAANSIHFVKDTLHVLRHFKTSLKPGGRLVIVEYNVDQGNTWVPYPFAYQTFLKLADEAGYKDMKLLHTVPSQFLREIYAASASC